MLALKRLFLGFFLIAAAAGVLLYADRDQRRAAAKPARAQRVALVQPVSNSVMDDSVRGVLEGLAVGGFADGKGMTLRRYNAEGDMANNNAIAREVTNGRYDVVLTLSTPTLQAIANANKTGRTKHVFGTVANPAASGVGISKTDPMDHPKWLTGVGTMLPAGDAFRMARRFFPGLKRVGVIWNAGEDNSRIFTLAARQACKELGIELLEANVENSSGVHEAASSLVSRGAQAIWVGGDSTVLSAIDMVIATARKGRIPVFTIVPGPPTRGTLFDLGAEFLDVGYITGLLAAQVMRGTDPASLPVRDYWPKKVMVNKLALAGLRDPWHAPPEILRGATVVVDEAGVHQQKTDARPTLAGALGISVPLSKKWNVNLIEYVNVLDSEEARQGIMDGLGESGLAAGKEYTVKVRNAQGDMGTLNSLLDAAVTDNADLIMTLSTPTLQAALQRAGTRPVVFTYVADPVVAGAGKSDRDHRPNVTGVYTQGTPEELLRIVRQLMPQAKSVGSLYAPAEVNSVFQRDRLVNAGRQLGLEVVTVGVSTGTEVPDAALALCGRKIDAVCQIAGNLTAVGFTSIVQAAKKARMPLFGMQGSNLQHGAAVVVSRDYHEGGRQAGLLAARVMRGESPAAIPFEPVKKTALMINLAAAHTMGLQIPHALIGQADKVIGNP